MRPTVAVVSRVSGLAAALAASPGTIAAELVFLPDPADLDSPRGTDALQRCEIMIGEPATCGPLVDRCENLKWLQSTFAGCNQLLTDSSRRDYTATRLAGCFGPDMAEYAVLHILALERRFDEQR